MTSLAQIFKFVSPCCRGDFGRLGHGDCNDVFIPQPIKALAGRNVVKVACGDTHTLAVTDTGELFSFGRNQNGQLGLGTTKDAILPQPVESLRVNPRLPGPNAQVPEVKNRNAIVWLLEC